MWRTAYRAHADVCTETAAWLREQRGPVNPDANQLKAYAQSVNRLIPALQRRRGPRRIAEEYDKALGEALLDMKHGGALPERRSASLARCLDRMYAFAALRPWALGSALLTPLVFPAFVLMTFPDASRKALASLPPVAYFAFVLVGVLTNAWINYALLHRLSDRPRIFGPYPYWAIPPALASFVLVFAAAYWIPSDAANACMDHALSRVDAVYFSLATFTTTGYGDLSPATGLCRGLASLQMAATFVLVALGVAVFVSRASASQPSD